MSSSYRPTSRSTERDDLNSSVLKNRKLLADAIKQKKHELTQEFKESYREKIIAVAEDTDNFIKPKEHKLRHALDALLVENKKRDGRLNELKLRLEIMKRDDISGAEIPEKPTEENLESEIELDSEKLQKGIEINSNNRLKDGKELIEKYLAARQTLEKVNVRRTEEGEIQKILDAKITELIRSQKVLTERIGKKGTFYNMMQKRFLNLGRTEFAAKNKLTRTNNKLLSLKKEIEKQRLHESDFFNQKQNVLKRSKSVVEEHKEIIAKNLIYLEEVKLKKAEIDEKLEEVEYEEKHIISKRQASEYILLYIDLLESLESGYLNEVSPIDDPQNIHISRAKERAKSMVAINTKELSQKPFGITRSQTIDLEKKGLNDTNKDRDIVITRIAQFYDQHPNGINALVSTLMSIYFDMQMKEQSLSTQHQDLNAERVKRQSLIKSLEDKLQAFHEGFILLEDKSEELEEASPEHIRETERRVAGKLSKYDLKTVQLGEYLVNLCAAGIRDALCKLNSASCSLASKAGKRMPTEIANKSKEIEVFLSEPKPDFSVSEAQSLKNKSTTKNSSRGEGTSANNTSLIQPKICSLAVPNSQEGGLKVLQNADQADEIKDVSRTEDVSKASQAQQLASEELTKLEQLLKSCYSTASTEIVYKWNEKIFEEKWMLDYLNKGDVQKILARYVYYYGNDITEGLMKNIIKDLKNEARLVQRKKTSEIFDLAEALFLVYIKHYKSRKNYLSQHFDIDIKSGVLDNLNEVMAVSEHVEKAQETRYQNMFSEPTEEPHIRKRTEEKPTSDSDMELVLLRSKNAQEVKIVKTTREAISELHSRYQKERKSVTSSHGQRSNSMPKLRVMISKKRQSFEIIQNDETVDGTHQAKENACVYEDKKHTTENIASLPKKKSASCVLRDSQIHAKIKEDIVEEERERDKKALLKKIEQVSVVKDDKKAYFVPSSFYRAQTKSKDIEEFMKRIVRDEEILRKITLLEKRQTEFDRKSKDYDKRKDYVPNFSLLHKYDLSKERKGDQTMQEWWKRQEVGTLDFSERGKSITSILLQSERKEEKSARHINQQLDSTRSIIYSQKRKSSSRAAVKPGVCPQEAIAQTTRTKGYGIKVIRKRENSLDDLGKKLYSNAVS